LTFLYGGLSQIALPPLDVGIGETVAIRIYEPLEEPVPDSPPPRRNHPNIDIGGVSVRPIAP
jgi:hypothetical protein